MSNCICPVCGKSTEGKQVRGVNFCETHRPIAIIIRDDPKLDESHSLKGDAFIELVLAVIKKSNKVLEEKGMYVKGTEIEEKIRNVLERVDVGTTLKLTFKREIAFAITGMRHVQTLLDYDILKRESDWQYMRLANAIQYRKWEYGDSNNVFIFEILSWSEKEKEDFIRWVSNSLYNIDIIY